MEIEELEEEPLEACERKYGDDPQDWPEGCKEAFCSAQFSCGRCPYGEFVKSYRMNLTPGNSIGQVDVEIWYCELFEEEMEFWT